MSIWWTSLALAILSVTIMSGLVLRRIRIQKRQVWWKQKKDHLLPAVFAYLEGTSFMVSLGRDIQPSDIRPLQEISLDLISSVRGETKDRLISLLMEAGGISVSAEQLRTGKEWERLQAVRNLSIYPREEVEDILRDGLNDPSPPLRIAVVRALIETGAEITLEELVEKLFSGDGVKSIALRDIFRRVAVHQVRKFQDILDREIPESLRLLAIDALGTTRDHSSLSILMEQFGSPSVDVRAEVIRALTTLGHPEASPVILRALVDKAWEVRAQAAVGAGRIGLENTFSSLKNLLDDEEWWVRFRAAEALKRIGDEGIKVLTESAKGTSRAAKIAELVLNQEAA